MRYFGKPVLGASRFFGIGMSTVIAIYSLILVAFGGWSETVGMLRGQPVDDRLARFRLVATAAAGTAAILVALGSFLWQIAHGKSGTDFVTLAFAAGLRYLVALGCLRKRTERA